MTLVNTVAWAPETTNPPATARAFLDASHTHFDLPNQDSFRYSESRCFWFFHSLNQQAAVALRHNAHSNRYQMNIVHGVLTAGSSTRFSSRHIEAEVPTAAIVAHDL